MRNVDEDRIEELIDRIFELADENGSVLSDSVVDKAIEFIKYLLQSGIDVPVEIEILPEGGIRLIIEKHFLKFELDLYKEKKAESRLYASDELIARFEGEILL